ncbi:MAG: regulatory protein RecX [Clostridia bacterium]|nr:regulatory protein RecX [Clostridia bacterium]
MGLVTTVENNRQRVNVYVDGTLFLRVRRKDFDRLPLEEGQDVDEDAYVDRLCALQMPTAYESALCTLDRRDMTSSGMKAALVRRGYVEAVADAVCQRLCENRLIDDRTYAERYVRHKANSGRFAIQRSLRAKGIDEQTADEAMELVDDDQQLQAAKDLAAKYAAKYEGLPHREARAKMSQALARRGFGWDVVSQAVDAALSEDADEW